MAMNPSASMDRRTTLATCVKRILARSCLAALPLIGSGVASATGRTFEFDPSFGGSAADQLDISRFNRTSEVVPGEYPLDVSINGQSAGRELIRFKDGGIPVLVAGSGVQPCLPTALLRRLGVMLPDDAGETECYDLTGVADEAAVRVDMQRLRIELSVPQANMRNVVRGDIDPALWDEGITAGLLNYDFSGFSVATRGDHQRQASLGLQAGFNIGGWRLRQDAIMQWRDGDGRHWQNTRATAQHDITRWRSQLTVGDGFTSGALYDSVGYRGVNLSTDNRMLPDSMSGYAPVVRGNADSNARVEIRQNGYLIHAMNVSPGPFVITDLGASGYGGDLQVSVIEGDGRVRTFTVPFSAVPQLLRPGAWRYSATLAQLRRYDGIDAPYFVEGTYQRGINNLLTLYGGAQLAEQDLYVSALVGGAVNTPAGAFSLGLVHSQADLGDAGQRSGKSLRLAYNKNLAGLGTNFALAAYRYSSEGYMALDEAAERNARQHGIPSTGTTVAIDATPKNRFDLTLNQRFGDRGGSLTVTGSRNHYWDSRSRNTSYQVGYNHGFGALTYSLNANRTRLEDGRDDTQFSLNLSVPLGNTRALARTRMDLELSERDSGRSGRIGVNGNAGQSHAFHYGASVSRDEAGRTGAMLNGSYEASAASLSAGYGRQDGTRQFSAGVSGGIVAHRGGVTFSQSLAETIGVVRAPGAKGARIGGGRTTVNDAGYGVVPSLTPYRYNEVTLDPKGTRLDVEFNSNLVRAVPRAGAVVALTYITQLGHPVLLRAMLPDGTPLPFGAQVFDLDGDELSGVGQGGQIYVRNLDPSGELRVRWGDDVRQSCRLPYVLPPQVDQELSRLAVTCRPEDASTGQVASAADATARQRHEAR